MIALAALAVFVICLLLQMMMFFSDAWDAADRFFYVAFAAFVVMTVASIVGI